MSTPETNRRAELDQFLGGDKLLRLSQRLMDWYEAPITDAEVADALGEALVPAFRYAQERLAGKVRKVTLEPAFCHSADVAFRAFSLGYPPMTLMVCLLHDVVEEVCRSIAEVPAVLADLSTRFPEQVVSKVALLTNRFQLIFQEVAPKLRADLPFEPRTSRAFRGALEALRYELPVEVARRFRSELDRLAVFFEGDHNWPSGAKIAARDRSFRVAKYLGRKIYRVYVDDLAKRAAAATLETGAGEPVTALVVKLLDLTDNIRTSEVSNRLSLYKLVTKAETLLDTVQTAFLEPLTERSQQRLPSGEPSLDTAATRRPSSTQAERDRPAWDLAARTTVPELHRLVRLRLVDQLESRRRAIDQHFAETRFASLVDFLAQQTARLMEKYDVPEGRILEIRALEEAIRAANTG